MTSFIISILFFGGTLLFLYLTYLRTIDKKSEQIIRNISTDIKTEFLETTVRFKNFDVLKKKKKFDFDIYKGYYAFNRADLYILDNTLVVVGKMKMLGKTRRLITFAICCSDNTANQTTIKYLTRHVKTELFGNDLEVEFEDEQYSNKIKIVIQKIGDKVYDKIKLSCFQAENI